MDLYKNNASGKYFIHLEDINRGNALFITPDNALKILELSLFESLDFMDEGYCLKQGLITQLQIEQYQKYMNRQ